MNGCVINTEIIHTAMYSKYACFFTDKSKIN